MHPCMTVLRLRAEAVLMARRVTRRKDVVLSGGLHPHYTETTETFLKYLEAKIDVLPADLCGEEDIAAHVGKIRPVLWFSILIYLVGSMICNLLQPFAMTAVRFLSLLLRR